MSPSRSGLKSLTNDSPCRGTRSFSAPRSGGSWASDTLARTRLLLEAQFHGRADVGRGQV